MSHTQASPTGKVALVTGSSRGIGRACIERLADTHQGLVIHCRRTPELAEIFGPMMGKTMSQHLTGDEVPQTRGKAGPRISRTEKNGNEFGRGQIGSG